MNSKYNLRRVECEEAARILSKQDNRISQLRDVDITTFKKYRSELPSNIRKRAEHVVYENERVLRAVGCLKKNSLHEFGRLMNESHASLRNLFEVSCFELDTMVQEAMKIKGTLGSRMTGAGFGGCTVSLVRNSCIDEFKEIVGREYKKKTGMNPGFYVTHPADGASQLL